MSAAHAPNPPAPRLVLVTGAARRLGREIGLAFARAGWDLAAHYGHSELEARALRAEVEKIGRRCWLVQGDLEHPDAAERLLDGTAACAGALPRCIINNAALFAPDDARDARPAGLQRHWAVNTQTPLLLANGLARRLGDGVEAGGHCVIHILDQKVHNLNPDYFSYTVSKLALAQCVALQAQALAPAVRVCGVSPGLLYLSGPQTADNFARASRVNLLRRAVAPADVARCVRFVAENASLNGTILQADNGQHLVALDRDVMFAVDGAPAVHAAPQRGDA